MTLSEDDANRGLVSIKAARMRTSAVLFEKKNKEINS
jgi:hypothetical protein